MLAISRKDKESVVIRSPDGTLIARVFVVEAGRGKVKLAFEADRSVRIDRLEVNEERERRKQAKGGV